MDEKLKAFSPAKQEGKTIDPAFNVNVKTKRGDDEVKAFAYFVRTGDKGAIKASNDTDMNVGTPADGGDAVPTGHFQGIIARRDESMLAQRLASETFRAKARRLTFLLTTKATVSSYQRTKRQTLIVMPRHSIKPL